VFFTRRPGAFDDPDSFEIAGFAQHIPGFSIDTDVDNPGYVPASFADCPGKFGGIPGPISVFVDDTLASVSSDTLADCRHVDRDGNGRERSVPCKWDKFYRRSPSLLYILSIGRESPL